MTVSKVWEVVVVESAEEGQLLSVAAINNAGVTCNVVVMKDGASAIEHILGGPLPDLIVLDYDLKDEIGLDVLIQLRSMPKSRYTRILMFSSQDGGGDMKECYRMGATSCVTKSSAAKDYLEHLSGILQFWLGASRPKTFDRVPQFAKAEARQVSEGRRERDRLVEK